MKKSILFFSFWLLFNPFPNFAQFEFGEIKAKGRATCIIVEKAGLYEQASLASALVETLGLGQKIAILGKTKEKMTTNGYTANWYLVAFEKDGQTRKGYIWGGAIAGICMQNADNEIFMLGVTDFKKGKGFWATAKIVKNGQELAQLKLPVMSFSENSQYDYCLSGQQYGNRGFSGVQSIFEIAHYYPACGYPAVNSYIFWDGKTLKLATEAKKMFDAGFVLIDTKLVFPDQKGGETDKLTMIETMEQYSEDGIALSKRTRQRKLSWDGNELRE